MGSGRSSGEIASCLTTLYVVYAPTVNLSGFATPWKISYCSQPCSCCVTSSQRALNATAKSAPLPGAAVKVITNRTAISSSLKIRSGRSPTEPGHSQRLNAPLFRAPALSGGFTG